MRNIVLLLAAIALATPAAAAPIDWSSIDRHYARSEACSDPGRPRRPAGAQGARSEAWAAAFLGWMLRVDRTRCPGLAAAAAIEIEIIVDPPERADVPLAFLDLAWRSAAEGLGRVRNPTAADRYGRIHWLLANEPPVWPEFTEPMQRQWLSRPEQIALLEAFLARSASGNARQARMLAELRSRRDLPGYDPRRAAELFGRAGDRARQAELMTGMAPAPSDAPAIAAAPVSQPAPRAAPAEPAPRVAPAQQAQAEAPAQPPRAVPAQQRQRAAPPPAPEQPIQVAQQQAPPPRVPPAQQAPRVAPAPPPSRVPPAAAARGADSAGSA